MAKPKHKASGSKSAPFLKTGQAPEPKNPDDLAPAFSFEKMQDGSGFSFNCCEDEDKLQLAKRIYMLSRLPWKDIRNASSKGLGSEEMPKFRIKVAIPNAVTEEVSSFTCLHYQGKKRFVGYRVGQVFYVLWIDHSFGVYDH